jgi:tetratricopeptide (TPR) repeat protein
LSPKSRARARSFPEKDRSDPRRVAGLAFAIFLLSLALHGLLWLQYRSDPFYSTHVSDALSYHQWAGKIAESGLAAEPVFHQSPLFPLLFGWLYRLVAPQSLAAATVLLQSLLGSTAIALLVPLGRIYFRSTAAGVTAALLVLLHGPFVFHHVKLLPVALALATQAWAMLVLGLARESSRSWLAVTCGVSWGLAAVARSEMLLFVPIALVALWLAPGDSDAKRVRRPWLRPAQCLVGLLIVIAPVSWHNLRQGDFVLIASAAGENLFIGNQRGAQGGHMPLDQRAGDLFSQRELARAIAEEAAGRELRPSEISTYWRGRAVEEIFSAPGSWLALEVRKLGLMLFAADPADIYPYLLERRRFLPVLYALPVAALGLWALALPGMIAALRTGARRIWPLAALVALHVLVLLLFFVSTRLRLPLLFFVASFAGHGVVVGLDWWRACRHRIALGFVVLVFVLASVHWMVFAAPLPREAVRLVVSEPSPDPIALDQAGYVHSKKGDLQAARRSYQRALEVGLPPPIETGLRVRLAFVHEKLGEPRRAAVILDEVVAAKPDDAEVWYARGMFRARQARYAAAEADFRQAAQLRPDWPAPREALRALGVTPP